jgi:hypothetical protein
LISILLCPPRERISLFSLVFSYGTLHAIETGVSLGDVLCRQFGMDRTYVDAQIQTVFVNGRAVDAVDETMIHDGFVIALSAAMPGLAGAVFRKGGSLKSMRSSFTRPESLLHQSVPSGSITLKMFNRVAADLGPIFLKRGVRIQKAHFNRFFDQNFTAIAAICPVMTVDGKKTKTEENMFKGLPEGDITLTVHAV